MNKALKQKLDSSKEINKAYGSDVVGFCVGILKKYKAQAKEPSLLDFRIFYYKTQGLKGLVTAQELVMAQGYSKEVAQEYTDIRVFQDTFKGVAQEIRAKQYIKKNYGLECRFATEAEDRKYCIDLVGEKFAIQVKPLSYKLGTNPSLLRDKSIHKEKHLQYIKETGKQIRFFFYDKGADNEDFIIESVK